MFLAGVAKWWYTDGWRQRINLVREQLARTLDFFSISILLQTLFAPFRQISAGGATGPIGVRLQAFFDRLISRFVGAFMRTILIVIGLFAIIFQIVWGVIVLAVWFVLPLVPIVGLILFSIGWVPS